ncbi:hypothetical protein DDM92_14455 [Vibrio cholerae]|nr:hypothetical protein [Vibrio cholerae]EGR4421814.1 hypothetical protein [Vibrio cholerae]EGR4432728.1 hypothetical protein [Vibrio cholerae]
MSKDYKLVEDLTYGIPVFRMESKKFKFNDIYDVVGKNEYVVTFMFRRGSDAYKLYGSTLTGIAHFSFHERQDLDGGIERACTEIKIIVLDNNLSVKEKCDLRYEGVALSDIKSIEFFGNRRLSTVNNNGIKEIPNIVTVEVDNLSGNIDVFNRNYLISKLNRGVKLPKYEQEQLIGIQLALNGNRIDSRLLSMYGYKAQTVLDDIDVAYHYYTAKCRNGYGSNEENKNLDDIKAIISNGRIIKVLEEIKLSKKAKKDSSSYPTQEFLNEVMSFRPQILLHGENQVYWDVDSFIHIAMRHIKDFQIGEFKNRTQLPYKHEDLSMLIEKVLNALREEITLHFKQKPDKDFVRSGSMAVRFNGDYFNLRINSDGRLYQFHSLS